MPLQLVKKSKRESRKAKPEVSKRGEKLIAELDRLVRSGKYCEVALMTLHGPIFSWQKYKLENLAYQINKFDPNTDISFCVKGWMKIAQRSDCAAFVMDIVLETLPGCGEESLASLAVGVGDVIETISTPNILRSEIERRFDLEDKKEEDEEDRLFS